MRVKVLLVYKAGIAASTDRFLSAVPVGLGILGAVLNAETGIAARVANLSADSWESIAHFLATERADIVALSIFTHNREVSKQIFRLAKEVCPECWVVCGGPHAGQAAEEVLEWPGVDAVVLGEGEETLRELALYRRDSHGTSLPQLAGLVVRSNSQAIWCNLVRQPVACLDDLPFAHRGLLHSYGVDIRQQSEFLITSRGCPAACVFCSSPGFWGRRLRYRSASSVVAEITALKHELGLMYYSIRDDTFTSDRRRVIEICRQLIADQQYILWNCQSRVTAVDEEMLAWMKRAGCECIQFGVESGSSRILEVLGKQITRQQIRSAVAAARRIGMQVSVYLITGVPGETVADVTETESLLKEILPHDGQVAPLAYYPGTALFCQAVSNGQVAADIFTSSSAEAIYVRTDPFVKVAVQRLLSCLSAVGKKAAYGKADFIAQKNVLGYCHATNLQAGDRYAALGQWYAARQEYEEIVRREPRNPWGWLALGEMVQEQELWKDARNCFEQVHRLAPTHLPALLALAEIAFYGGDRRAGKRWLAAAADLAPGDPSLEALQQLVAKR